jgi:diacylglycerol O-acyltransferase-1
MDRCDSAFLSGVTLMLLTCIVWLKLVSYAHTSYDIRSLANAADKVKYEKEAYVLVTCTVLLF